MSCCGVHGLIGVDALCHRSETLPPIRASYEESITIHPTNTCHAAYLRVNIWKNLCEGFDGHLHSGESAGRRLAEASSPYTQLRTFSQGERGVGVKRGALRTTRLLGVYSDSPCATHWSRVLGCRVYGVVVREACVREHVELRGTCYLP